MTGESHREQKADQFWYRKPFILLLEIDEAIELIRVLIAISL